MSEAGRKVGWDDDLEDQMSTHPQKWPAGTPCWVDLMATDLDRTHAFYGEVLGWTYTEPMDGFGGYHNALASGQLVAGLSPTMPGMEDAPKRWGVHLATDDLAATRDAVVAAGGQVVAEPVQVGDFGAMGLFSDPTGALFSAWQSGTHTGINLVGEPGAPLWMDLMTADIDAAKAFYASVFGFSYTDMSSEAMRYVMFSVPGGGRPAGGIGQLDGSSTWTTCFQVADVDTLAGRLDELGGALVDEPRDLEWGRLVGATGPDGEKLYLLTPTQA